MLDDNEKEVLLQRLAYQLSHLFWDNMTDREKESANLLVRGGYLKKIESAGGEYFVVTSNKSYV